MKFNLLGLKHLKNNTFEIINVKLYYCWINKIPQSKIKYITHIDNWTDNTLNKVPYSITFMNDYLDVIKPVYALYGVKQIISEIKNS